MAAAANGGAEASREAKVGGSHRNSMIDHAQGCARLGPCRIGFEVDIDSVEVHQVNNCERGGGRRGEALVAVAPAPQSDGER